MAADFPTLLRRHERLLGLRGPYDAVREELATFLRPEQLGFTGKRSPGETRTSRLFDSTGIDANESLAASMAGGLTNEALEWFSLRMTDPALNDLDEVSEHLDARRRIMLQHLSQSNFYAEILEAYEDLGAFGMAAVFVEEQPVERAGFNGLRTETWPLSSVAISEDGLGRVTTVHHDVELAAHAVVGRWGDAVSDKVRKVAATDPDEVVRLLHVVAPREAGDPPAWAYRGVIGEIETKSVLEVGGYPELPVAVPRWRKKTGEVYGHGPGHTALPDLKTLNRAVENDLRAWGKAIDPPLKIRHGGMLSPVRLVAGGTTYVEDMDAIQELTPNLGKFQVSQIKIAALQAAVRTVFFNQRFQLPEAGPAMTAREVMVRAEIMQRLFGPTLGRLLAELFGPVIARVHGLLDRAGVFPPLPQVLAGQEFIVQYESPLARAQRMAEVDTIQRFVAEDVPLAAQLDPRASDNVDVDALLRFLGQRRGVPGTILRDARDVQARRDAAAGVARDEQAKSDAERQAAALGKVAPLLQAAPGAGRADVGTAAPREAA